MPDNIVTPLTPDAMCGWDSYDQLWYWKRDERDPDALIGSIIADLRGKTCAICKRSWEPVTAQVMADQHRVDFADAWVHNTCWLGHQALSEHALWYGALCRSKLMSEHTIGWRMESIPNEYGGDWNTPWFLIQPTRRNINKDMVPNGFTFKVGRRKRVWSMTLGLKSVDFSPYLERFKDEEVTKFTAPGELTVHAWTTANTADYLEKLIQIMTEIEEKT